MSYLFNELRPLAGNTGLYCGKNKGVLLTNNTTSGLTAGLFVYNDRGITFQTTVGVQATSTEIFPARVWGVTAPVGLTGGVIA